MEIFNKTLQRFTKILLLTVLISSNYLLVNSQDANFYYSMSVSEFRYNQIDLAFYNINKAINLENNNFQNYLRRADMYYALQNYNSALLDYQKAEKLKSNSAQLQIAKTYAIQNKVDSAIYFLSKYLKYYNKISQSEIILDTAFRQIKTSQQWKKLWQKKHYSKADESLADASYMYKYDKKILALEELNSLLKTYKHFHKAYFLKAQILYDAGNNKEALKNINKAINISTQNIEYHNFRADIYTKLKKENNAIEDYLFCLSKNPNYDTIHYKIAITYTKKKMYEDALQNIDYYTKIYHNNNIASYQKAKINYLSGNFLETLRIMNILINKDKKQPEYYCLRGKALLNANSFEASYTDFSLALDINPKYTENYYYMGIANLKMEKIDNACADWKAAIDNKNFKAYEYYYKYCKDYDKMKNEELKIK